MAGPDGVEKSKKRAGRQVTIFVAGVIAGLVLGLVAGIFAGPLFSAPTSANGEPSATASPIATVQETPVSDEQNTINVAAAAIPGVVQIPTSFEHPVVQNGMTVPQTVTSIGSGFLYEPGHIVTNYHIVHDNSNVTVILADGSEVSGQVIGRDQAFDLAVIAVDTGINAKILPLGSSANLKVGQKAIVIGSPFGLEESVSAGVVSGTGRQIPEQEDETGALVDDAVQTDAAINPGNSGGPLLDSEGKVIGIVSTIVSPNRLSNGVGMAIAVDFAKKYLPVLVRDGKIPRPTIGANIRNVVADDVQRLNLPAQEGVVVISVQPGGPAANAGLRDETTRPDVIVGIDGQPVRETADLVVPVWKHQAGDTVTLSIIRDGQKIEVSVTLAIL